MTGPYPYNIAEITIDCVYALRSGMGRLFSATVSIRAKVGAIFSILASVFTLVCLYGMTALIYCICIAYLGAVGYFGMLVITLAIIGGFVECLSEIYTAPGVIKEEVKRGAQLSSFKEAEKKAEQLQAED